MSGVLSLPLTLRSRFPSRAAAKAGKTVLHLDAAEGYGGEWGVLPEAAGAAGWLVPRRQEATPSLSHSRCQGPSTPPPPLPTTTTPTANTTIITATAAPVSASFEAGEVLLPSCGTPTYAAVYVGATTITPGEEHANVAHAQRDALPAPVSVAARALGPRRGYVVDLAAPKLVHCSGGLVEALVASGAHRYTEFKALEVNPKP